MKVLIADDQELIRFKLHMDLEKWGYEVVSAENGQEAWEKFQAGDSRLVISDWEMPVMNGLELVRRIREASTEKYVYIIMLTARSETEDVVDGMETGADDFLTKPFKKQELRVRLRAGERIVQLEQSLAARNMDLEEALIDLKNTQEQ